MATTAGELVVKIMADTDGFQRGMGSAERSLSRADGRFRSAASGGVKLLGKAMLGVGVIAGGGLVAGIVKGTQSLIAHEQANAQTAAVLKSTGNAANVTAAEVANLAGQLEMKTGVDDVAIKSSQNLLLTFTNVRNEVGRGNDIFNQATVAALDMSVALGTDLQTATMQVGKALNNPIQGLGALKRAGVDVDDGMKKTIKTMVEQGNVAGAQKLILAELTKEFGGSAKAAGETFAGQLNIAKARLEEVAEKLAMKFLPALTGALSWINSNWPQIEAVFTAVFDGIGWAIDNIFKPAIEGIKGIIEDVREPVARALDGISEAFNTVMGAISGVINQHRGTIEQALNTIRGVFEVVWGYISRYVANVWEAIKGIVEVGAGALGGIIDTAMQLLQGNWGAAWDTLRSTAASAWEGLQGVVDGYLTGLRDNVQQTADDIVGRWPAVGEAFNTVSGFVQQAIDGVFKPAVEAAGTAAGAVKDLIVEAWPQIKGIFESVGGAIADVINTIVLPVLKFLGDEIRAAVAVVQENWPKIKGYVVDTLNAVRTVIDAFITVVKAAWGRFGDDIAKVAQLAWDTIKGVIEGAIKIIQGVIDTLIGVITGDWGRAWDGMKGIVSGAFDAVKTVIVNSAKILGTVAVSVGKAVVDGVWKGVKVVGEKVLAALKYVWNALTGAVRTALSKAKEVGKSIVDGVITGLAALFAKVKNGLKAIWDALVGAIETAASKAAEIGVAIVQGVWAGIQSLGGWIKDQIVGAALGWLQSAKEAVGLGSPAKKWMPIGVSMMEGVAVGIANGTPVAEGAVGRALAAITNAAAAGAKAVGSAIAKGAFADTLVGDAARQFGVKTVRSFLLGMGELPEKMSEKMQEALDKARGRVERAQEAFRTAFGKFAESFKTAFDAVTSSVAGEMTDALNASLSAFDQGTNAHVTATEQMLLDMEAAFRRGDLERAVTETQAAVDAALTAGMDTSSAEYLRLLDARDKAAFELLKANSADKIAAEKQAWIDSREEQRKGMEETGKDAVLQYESQRALQAEHLEKRFEQLSEKLATGEITEKQYQKKLTGLIREYLPEYGSLGALLGQGFVTSFDEKRSEASGAATRVSDAIAKALFGSLWQTKRRGRDHMDSFVDGIDNGLGDAEQSGVRAGEAFARGLKSTTSAVGAAAASVAAAAAANLKLSSPAKEGPMADLDQWWKPLASTLLDGLDTRPIRYSLLHLLGRRRRPPGFPKPPGGGGGGPALPAERSRSSSQGNQVVVHVAGHVTADRDLAMVVRDELIRMGKRNTSIFSGMGVTP